VANCQILSDFLGISFPAYLDEDHGGDLLGGESLLLTEVLDLDLGAAVVVDNLERPGLDVLLDGGVIESAANETPGRAVRGCPCLRFSFPKLT
jgi:hypothetical protein